MDVVGSVRRGAAILAAVVFIVGVHAFVVVSFVTTSSGFVARAGEEIKVTPPPPPSKSAPDGVEGDDSSLDDGATIQIREDVAPTSSDRRASKNDETSQEHR